MRISIRIDSKAAQAQLRRWGGEFRDKVKKAMADVRETCDELEARIPKSLWPLPTYHEMLLVK